MLTGPALRKCFMSTFVQPFNSKRWPILNFSLWYQYVFLQTVYENTETYQEEVFILILHQILVAKLRGIV